MARYHELNITREKLRNIRNIMHSMKTIAQMEAHKLEHFIQAQIAISQSIEAIASDFMTFYPETLPDTEPAFKIVLLIGSERGFCGDFNGHLLNKFEQEFVSTTEKDTLVIALGHKLQALLYESMPDITYLKGANITEEIISVVEFLIQTLSTIKQPATLYAIYHNEPYNAPCIEKLLPSFTHLKEKKSAYNQPPLLNLTPQKFLLELTDHHLQNALYRILYTSVMAENQLRIHHLENATQYLDKKTDGLLQKIKVLRQEEIIEEIEVILLNQSDIDILKPFDFSPVNRE